MTAPARKGDSQNQLDEWAARCEYWLEALERNTPKRKRRERQKTPLTLTGHGLSMQVEKGTLLIRDGNTHYPAERREFRFFKGDLNLPSRIVLVDGSGSITLDALDWLAEQKTDLIRLNYDGRIISLASTSGYAADRQKVTWQIATRANEEKRVAFSIPLIRGKIKETLINLQDLLPPSTSREKAILTAKSALDELKQSPPESVSKLLAVEGAVAQGYFYAWRALEMKWKAVKRYPIPEDWKRFFSRSSLNIPKQQNRNATHPINAMLNYAYAILESSVRIDSIADGYDPSIGIMHDRMQPDRHSFVFDLMEPRRPVADRTILKLIQEETFSGADFMLQPDGVVRVNPELLPVIIN